MCLLYTAKTNSGVVALAQGGVGVGAGLSKEVRTTETGKGNAAKVSLEKEWPFRPHRLVP